MRVYVETTAWSFALATDSPPMTLVTNEFFEACGRGEFLPLVSLFVTRELERSDEPTRTGLLELVARVSPELVPVTVATERLAAAFLRLGAVPPSKPEDAGHVAAAFTAGADALVSWNFKHIASTRRAEKFNAIALLEGFPKHLTITTPGEILDGPEAH